MRHQSLKNGARCIVCNGANPLDLDAYFPDIVLRTAFRQDPPASKEWSDSRKVFEVFALDCRIDVHHCQLSLHEAGELHGMGERRRFPGGKIRGMKDTFKG